MESEETLINASVILEAINGLQQEINERFGEVNQRLDRVEQRLEKVELRLTHLENDAENVKNVFVNFDIRLDRQEGLIHEALNVGYTVRTDLKNLRRDIFAASPNLTELEQKI